MWLVAFVLTIIMLSLLFEYNKRKFSYWKSRGVSSPPYLPILGHVHHLFNSSYPLWKYHDKIYKELKHKKLIGMYDMYKPRALVVDSEFIKRIMVKDFDYFVNRRHFPLILEEDIVFNKILTNLVNEEWKRVRSTMTPTFSSGKIKIMYKYVQGKADDLVDFCKTVMKDENSVDVRDALGRYALEVIACCSFGIEANAFFEKNSYFVSQANQASTFSYKSLAKFALAQVSPKLCKTLKIRMAQQSIYNLIDVIKNTIKSRQIENFKRGDFLDLLLDADLDNTDDIDKKVLLLAQTLIFLIAGYDTVANSTSIAIYHLAKYPEEQDKIREEINSLLEDGTLSYQSLMEAPYLEAFLSESMRMIPIGFVLERLCNKEYRIPELNITIDKGMIVTIPTYSLHHDPDYWDEPEEFRPSRFFPENKDSIKPYTYMPFGMGPRNCIGMRFALMEVKLAIVKLVMAYKISLPEGAQLKIKQLPVAIKPDNLRVIFSELESSTENLSHQ